MEKGYRGGVWLLFAPSSRDFEYSILLPFDIAKNERISFIRQENECFQLRNYYFDNYLEEEWLLYSAYISRCPFSHDVSKT